MKFVGIILVTSLILHKGRAANVEDVDVGGGGNMTSNPGKPIQAGACAESPLGNALLLMTDMRDAISEFENVSSIIIRNDTYKKDIREWFQEVSVIDSDIKGKIIEIFCLLSRVLDGESNMSTKAISLTPDLLEFLKTVIDVVEPTLNIVKIHTFFPSGPNKALEKLLAVARLLLKSLG